MRQIIVKVPRGHGEDVLAAADEQIEQQLTRQIQRELLNQGFNVTPLIDVTVLAPP